MDINSSDTLVIKYIKHFGSFDGFFDKFRVDNDSDEYRILQPIWDLRLGWESTVASPLFPIVFSISLYFLTMLPWSIIDLYGQDWKWIQRYKIQPGKDVTWTLMRKAIVLTMWNQVLYILPISIAQVVWTPDTELPKAAPGLFEFCWHHYVAIIIFDAEYGLWHFIHHKIRFLYRHVHSVHHQYHSPHCWVSQYLHPYELITIGIFATTSPWIVSSHPMTHWSFSGFVIIISVESHIGYDLPLMPHKWAPFWGGVLKHDMHHQKPLTNYQPFLNQFDRLFGTECPGQMAGGYKPPSLLEWERKQKVDSGKRLQEQRVRREMVELQCKIDKKLEELRLKNE